MSGAGPARSRAARVFSTRPTPRLRRARPWRDRIVAVAATAMLSGLPVLEAFGEGAVFGAGVVEIETAAGERHAFDVEVAATDAARRQGLMFRTSMPRDAGMLFDFRRERRLAMWMKNTSIPLDMLFADDAGRIVRVARATEPYSLETIPSGGPARFVLELNAGVTTELEIAAGDRLTFSEAPSRP